MRTPTLTFLCLMAALAPPAVAQETSDTDTAAEAVMTDEVMDDEVMENETMAEDAMEADTMSDETMEADAKTDAVMDDDVMADEAMTDEVMEDAAPSLEDIAASDPNLEVSTNADGEVDAMVMLSDVLFDFGDAALAPAALDTLRGVADKLDGVAAIEITGHTDAIGDEAFNLALGQRRADAVRDWLIANTALTADVITARGVGEADPIAPNRTEAGADNPEGRALNRRVEFTLPGEEG